MSRAEFPKTAATNGITLEYFEQGEGPCCCMAFPEMIRYRELCSAAHDSFASLIS